MSAYDWTTPPINCWGTVARQCGDKRRYANKAQARRAIRSMRTLLALRAYRCALCAGWHLTRRPVGETDR